MMKNTSINPKTKDFLKRFLVLVLAFSMMLNQSMVTVLADDDAGAGGGGESLTVEVYTEESPAEPAPEPIEQESYVSSQEPSNEVSVVEETPAETTTTEEKTTTVDTPTENEVTEETQQEKPAEETTEETTDEASKEATGEVAPEENTAEEETPENKDSVEEEVTDNASEAATEEKDSAEETPSDQNAEEKDAENSEEDTEKKASDEGPEKKNSEVENSEKEDTEEDSGEDSEKKDPDEGNSDGENSDEEESDEDDTEKEESDEDETEEDETEEEPVAFDGICIYSADNVTVHVTGVFPAGSHASVTAVSPTDVSAARGSGKYPAGVYAFDITMVNAEGEVKPEGTAYLTFGIDTDATNAILSVARNIVIGQVMDSLGIDPTDESDAEYRNIITSNVSVAKSDITLDVYHVTDHAERCTLENIPDGAAIPGAEMLVAAEAPGFSEYVVEATVSDNVIDREYCNAYNALDELTSEDEIMLTSEMPLMGLMMLTSGNDAAEETCSHPYTSNKEITFDTFVIDYGTYSENYSGSITFCDDCKKPLWRSGSGTFSVDNISDLSDDGFTITAKDGSVHSFDAQGKAVHTHTWDEGVVTTPATCTAAGVKTYTCSVCKETKTEEIPATGHTWDAGTATDASACTKEGTMTYTCTTCKETKTEVIPVHHASTELRNAVAATSTEHGYTGDTYCTLCGTKISTGETIHTWDKGVVTTAATCKAPGVMTYTCVVPECGVTKTEAIPVTGHKAGSSETVAPTCTTDGYTVYTCSVCEAKYTDNKVAALGHSFGEPEIIKQATCMEKGTKKYTCTVCSATKEEEYGPVDHNWEEDTTGHVNATCSTAGSATYHCSYGCGASKTEVIPATGVHNWEEDTTKHVDATCGTAGSTTYNCTYTECTEKTKKEVIPATGNHTWVVQYNTATCTEEGEKASKCSVCGETKTEEVASLGGHAMPDAWTTVTAATCTSAGLEKRVCTHTYSVYDSTTGNYVTTPCTYTETQAIPALGHNYDTDSESSKYLKCKTCGKTYPEVQAVLDDITAANLPSDTTGVSSTNAQEIYNEVTALLTEINNLKTTLDADTTADKDNKLAAYNTYAVPQIATLTSLQTEAQKYLAYTTYTATTGQQESFEIDWNDNNDENGYRAATAWANNPADFPTAANAYLTYEIKDSAGNVVDTGTLRSAADANTAFEFIGVNLPVGTALVNYNVDKSDAVKYTLSTSSDLPTGYTATYTNYASGETSTADYTIEYTLHMQNPETTHYIVTSPSGATNTDITIANNGKAVITVLESFSAHIQWHDNSNYAENNDTPRLTEAEVASHLSVYRYRESYNTESGELVTGGYSLSVTRATGSNDDLITITGLPAYDNEGNALTYYVSSETFASDNADTIPGNRYYAGYVNSGNYAAKQNGVYNNGYLVETLYNTVTYSVNKVWVDDLSDTPEKRPQSTISIWSTLANSDGTVNLEDAYPVAYTPSTYSVPKAGGTLNFYRTLDNGTTYLFPRYDSEGRLYVYFGKETVPSGYTSTITYPSGTTTTIADGYFLNGSTITNTANNEVSVPLTKSFKALAIQNATPITSTFVLQKKDASGNWVAATAADILSYDTKDKNATVTVDASKVQVVLTGFSAETMSSGYSGIVANKYLKNSNNTYTRTEYRWIETGVSVNGVSADYTAANWTDDGSGNLTYNGTVRVNNGQTSTKTSGPNNTTALFTSSGDGSTFENDLSGKSQVDVKKYFYDENGNNIADSDKLKDAKVTFNVYRNGTLFDTVELTADDLTDGANGKCWEELLNYDRYDEEGREYQFKVTEASFTDSTSGITWGQTTNYKYEVIEYPAGSGVLLPRLTTQYVNAPNPGKSLTFDVEKQWKDDSDQESRNPVVAAIYRYKDVNGNLLATPELVVDNIELNLENNWYQKRTISVEDERDTVDNYILVETGIKVNGVVVSPDKAQEFTSAYFNSIRPTGKTTFAQTYLGTVGSTDAEGDSWDGLNYVYKAYVEEQNTQTAMAGYILTNVRTGKQNYDFNKNWNAGSVIDDATFALYQGDTQIATFDLLVNTDKTAITVVEHWADGSTHGLTGSITKDSKGNYQTHVDIDGLEKFDANGVQLNYRIEEIKIKDSNGNWINVANNSATVDGKTYSVSYNSAVAYEVNNKHRSPDVFTYTVSNSLSESYSLVSNKVWRDDLTTERPDVTFTLY